MNIEELRKEYSKSGLKDNLVASDPFKQFKNWFDKAIELKIPELNNIVVATSTKDGIPSARVVLLKNFNENGFVFFTNFRGRKGKELEENPKAALVIYWNELERQVRIEGLVEKISNQESDTYFRSRPLESQISAVISQQSQVVPGREHLEDLWIECMKENYSGEIIRPEYWGGYRVRPEKMEFWQGRPNRLNDRILYSKIGDRWKIERLAP